LLYTALLPASGRNKCLLEIILYGKEGLDTMPQISKLLETPNEAETMFYDAIARADIETVMSLWADEEEIVCIHPGAPRLIGHAAIRQSWEQIFEKGGVNIRPVQAYVSQNVMTSVHNVIEEVHRTNSKPQDIHILATNVYMKTPLGWRLVSHHASVVPGEAPSDIPVTALLH
jgi:ketosteroid isomerase-like protein